MKGTCTTYPPGGRGGRLGGVDLLVTRAVTAWMMASLWGECSVSIFGSVAILTSMSSTACLSPPIRAAESCDIKRGSLNGKILYKHYWGMKCTYHSSSLMRPLLWETMELEPNRSRCTGSAIVIVFADTAWVLSYRRKQWYLISLSLSLTHTTTHLLSKDKVWWWKFRIFVDNIDWGLVDQGNFPVCSQHFPLFFVEADVGIQAHTKKCYNLVMWLSHEHHMIVLEFSHTATYHVCSLILPCHPHRTRNKTFFWKASTEKKLFQLLLRWRRERERNKKSEWYLCVWRALLWLHEPSSETDWQESLTGKSPILLAHLVD